MRSKNVSGAHGAVIAIPMTLTFRRLGTQPLRRAPPVPEDLVRENAKIAGLRLSKQLTRKSTRQDRLWVCLLLCLRRSKMLPKTSGPIHNNATLPMILWTFNVGEPLQNSRLAPTSGDLKPFFAWIGLPLRCGW